MAKSVVKKTFITVKFIILGIIYAIFAISQGNRVSFKRTKKDVLLCGNGPSLDEIDLKKVRDEGLEIACVNFFPSKNFLFFDVKPKYLFLIDPVFFSIDDKNANDGNIENIKELFITLEKVDWDLIVISLQGQNLVINNKFIHYEHLSKWRLSGENMLPFLDFLYGKNLVIPGACDCLIPALYYFINTTNSKIYICGVDMDGFKHYVVDKENNVYAEIPHSYGTDLYRLSSEYSHGKFYKMLNIYSKAFEQFYYISQYAKRKNVEVVNLSTNSYLDMFDKYDDIKYRV